MSVKDIPSDIIISWRKARTGNEKGKFEKIEKWKNYGALAGVLGFGAYATSCFVKKEEEYPSEAIQNEPVSKETLVCDRHLYIGIAKTDLCARIGTTGIHQTI